MAALEGTMAHFAPSRALTVVAQDVRLALDALAAQVVDGVAAPAAPAAPHAPQVTAARAKM